MTMPTPPREEGTRRDDRRLPASTVVAGTGTGDHASRWSAMTPELRPSSGNNVFVFPLPKP